MQSGVPAAVRASSLESVVEERRRTLLPPGRIAERAAAVWRVRRRAQRRSSSFLRCCHRDGDRHAQSSAARGDSSVAFATSGTSTTVDAAGSNSRGRHGAHPGPTVCARPWPHRFGQVRGTKTLLGERSAPTQGSPAADRRSHRRPARTAPGPIMAISRSGEAGGDHRTGVRISEVSRSSISPTRRPVMLRSDHSRNEDPAQSWSPRRRSLRQRAQGPLSLRWPRRSSKSEVNRTCARRNMS
jgi:hypothetical protein